MRRLGIGCVLVLVFSLGVVDVTWASERSRIIALASGNLDVTAPLEVRRGLQAQEQRSVSGISGEIELVKLRGPADAETLASLEASVERIYAYLPHDAFLVLRKGETPLPAAVAWSGAYHPAYKLGPAVAALEAGSSLSGEPQELVTLMVRLFPDAPVEIVAAELSRLDGLAVVGKKEGERFSRVRLQGPAEAVVRHRETLARYREVFWVEREARRVLLNDTTVWVGQSGTTGGQATPVHDHGILGEGQVVGVLDTGLDPDMCYFRDPVEGLPTTNLCDGGTAVNPDHRKVLAVNFLWDGDCDGGVVVTNEWDDHDHGTHVAGTVAGDNLANLGTRDSGDGMAPAAKLVIQDGGIETDNCADLPGLGCPVVDLNPIFQQAYDQGARIHTNSWGDRENFTPRNIYSAGSEDADEFMWNHKDFLLFFAAGNSGGPADNVGSPATGKNVLAVGSTQRGGSAEFMSGFSSCGPTDDERIKPDVTVPGSSIVSANSDNNTGTNNCNTRTMSGTSMASPGAAGLGALTRQYFTDGFYPSGAAEPGDAFTPSAALVKATLINSAQAMTNVGAIPSNCQGWGRVLLDNALSFTGETRRIWVEDDTTGFGEGASGDSRTFEIDVESFLEPLKVTLTWTDFPSNPAAASHLVNDLDLTVTGPGGTFFGNVLSGGLSTTGGTADRIDTVEQVILDGPDPGIYTVTVSAFNVPQGPQPFALVVTGDSFERQRMSLFMDGFESGNTSAWDSVAP